MSAPAAPTSGRPASRWRRRAVVVLLGLACGALLLLTTTQAWVVATLPAGPGGTGSTGSDLPVTGATATAVVPALGLVAVAGSVALSTLRGAGRSVAAVLLVLVALGVAASVAALLADPVTGAQAAARAATGVPEVDGARTTAWPLLALVPAAGVLLVGVLALVSGRAWATSARFEAPADGRAAERSRPARSAVTTRAGLWDGLSQGDDPTADPTADAADAADAGDGRPDGEGGDRRAPGSHGAETRRPAE